MWPMSPILVLTFCAIIQSCLKTHKMVLNSTRPLKENTDPLIFLKGCSHRKSESAKRQWRGIFLPSITEILLRQMFFEDWLLNFHFSDDHSLCKISMGECLCSRAGILVTCSAISEVAFWCSFFKLATVLSCWMCTFKSLLSLLKKKQFYIDA